MINSKRLFSGICLAAALSIGSASAQMRNSLEVTLNQNFTANGVKLPAGEYTITGLSGAAVNSVLLLRSASGITTNVLAEPVTAAQQSQASTSSVTLHRVGDHLQLDEVWLNGSETGYRILSNRK